MEHLSAEDVQVGLAEGTIVLVDVREPHEFAAERIHGALNFPLSTFDPASLPTNGAKRVVLHCAAGKRSMTALQACAAADVVITAHLEGGLGAWKAAGLPTISVDPATGQVRESR